MAFFDKVKDTITTGIKNTVKGVAEKAFATPNAPSYTQPKKTAYQNITAQPVETKWYKGAVPTASEMEARAIKVGQQDYQRGEYLYGLFQETQNDPASPLYNPYTKPTSQAASELSAMGFDVSDPNFIQNNAWLKGEYRLGTNGSPLAPSNSSTAEQNAAYWYNKYMDDEETTLKAEQEWAALQEEVGYWAGRKDRNLTDEEIYAKINWNNYPTLKRMDEAKGKGLSVGLTRPIGYSQDALNGVIYGKRNGVEGDPSRLAVRAAYDGSTGYQRNEEVASRLNPNSDMYNPYAVGSTIDDQALYFGVDSFDKDWVANNRQYMSSMDETERRMYNAVAKAEANTSAAETEHAALMAYIDEQIAAGETDPDEIIEKVYGDGWGFDMAENGKTLAKMDESLEPGGTPMAMTRAVPYSRNDVERYIQERCEAENQKKGMDAVVGGLQSFMEKFLTPKELTATEKIAADIKRLVENAVPPTTPEVPEATSEVPAAEDVELGLLPYTRKNPTEIDAPAVKVDEVINPATAMAQMPANPVNPPNPEAMKVTASVVVSHGTEDEKKALKYHVANGSLANTRQFSNKMDRVTAGGMINHVADNYALTNGVQIRRADGASSHGENARLLAETEQIAAENAETIAREQEYAEYAEGIGDISRVGKLSNLTDEQKEAVKEYAYAVGWQKEDSSRDWENESYSAMVAAGIDPDTIAFVQNIVSDWATETGYSTDEVNNGTILEDRMDKVVNANPYEGLTPKGGELSEAEKKAAFLEDKIAEYKAGVAADEEYQKFIDKKPGLERLRSMANGAGGRQAYGGFDGIEDAIDYSFDVIEFVPPERKMNQDWQDVRYMAEQSGIDDVDSYMKQWSEKTIADYDLAIEKNNEILRYIKPDENGNVAIPGYTEDEIAAIEAETDRVERKKYETEMYLLTTRDDFDDVVQRVKEENKGPYDISTPSILLFGLEGKMNAGLGLVDDEDAPFVTDEEKDIILYLYDQYGEDAAVEYKNYLLAENTGVVNVRRSASVEEGWTQFTREAPILAIPAAILATPFEALGSIGFMAETLITGGKADPYSSALNVSVAKDAVNNTVYEWSADTFGEGSTGEFLFNLCYGAVFSAGESLVMSVFTGGIDIGSNAQSVLGKFGFKAINSTLQAAPIASIGAQRTYREAYAQTGSHEKALMMAGISFVAETFSESISIDNIRSAFKGGAEGTRRFLQELVPNMFEEGTGEMISAVIQQIGDDTIMGEYAKREGLIEKYHAEGMSLEDAAIAADKEILKNILYSGMTGALSAGVSTSVPYVAGRAGSNISQTENTETVSTPDYVAEQTVETVQGTEPVASNAFGGLAILAGVEGDDVNAQAKTEAVAAALVTSEEQMPSAIASAQEMNSEYGDEATRNFVVDVITKAGMNAQTAGAIVAASLSKGESHQTLTSMVTGETEVTPETVNQLVETAEADAQNPEIQGEIMGNIQRSVINNAVIDAGNAGGFNSIASQQTAVQTANQKLEEAKSVLQDEKHRYQALGESLNDAVAQFNADPTNQQIEALVTQVAKDMEGQNKMVKQAEQTVTNASQSVQNANKQLELTKATTLDNLRQQETQRIAEETAQAEQAKAEQAKQAEIQRQEDNITELETENFISENGYEGATDEDRAVVRQQMGNKVSDQTTVNDRFMRQVSKRFGINIRVTENIEAEGAYEADTDTIVISKGASQSDVLKRVLAHELTHRTEGTEYYGELVDTLLELAYGTDKAKMEADLKAIYEQYSSSYGKAEGDAIYTEELIAHIAGDLLSSTDAINRIIADKPSKARQLLDAIRNFLNKIRGVNDPFVDKLRKVENLMTKALDEGNKGSGTKFSLRQTNDGTKYVEVDTDQDIFEGRDESEYPKIVREYIKRRFRGKVIGTGENVAFVDARTGSEYTNPAKKIEEDVFESKLRAATELDNILEASVFIDHNPDDGRHRYFPNGFDHYETFFSVSNRMFEAVINIGIDKDGRKHFYDLTKIKSLNADIWVKQHGGVAAQLGNQGFSDAIISEQPGNVNKKFSLPSPSLLNYQINNWRNASDAKEVAENTKKNAETPKKGERRFSTVTAQNIDAVPDPVKSMLLSDPMARYYDVETNRQQINEAYARIEKEGRDNVIDRLMEVKAPTANEIAEANVIFAQAVNEGDLGTAMDIAAMYAITGTEQGKAFQLRNVIKKMSSAGFKMWAAGKHEAGLKTYMAEHPVAVKEVTEKAQEKAEKIKGLRGGNELQRITESDADYVITPETSRYGMPVSPQQQEIIELFGLEKVKRPGDSFYNKASTKQRMLEYILATDDFFANTGGGLNALQRLEYMAAGNVGIVTPVDLAYFEKEMKLFSELENEDSEEALIHLRRAYEANANVPPMDKRTKRRNWRFTSMLLSVPSAARNVIGNLAMQADLSTSHGIAVFLDKIAAKKTGKRVYAPLTLKERIDGWKAFVAETKKTYRDVYVDRVDTNPMANKYRENERGRVFQNAGAEFARNAEMLLMSIGDRNIWMKAFRNSMAEQERIADLNGEKFDADVAMERAEKEANYAVFNEDSKVRDSLARFKENTGVWGDAFSLIMPFTGVPTNIAKRMFEYSPFGVAKALVNYGRRKQQGKAFDQYTFISDLSKGLTGTFKMFAGFALAMAGVIKFGTKDEEDAKVSGVKQAKGNQYNYYMEVLGVNIDVAFLGPFVTPLLMGAEAYRAVENDQDVLETVWNTAKAACEIIFDASYMSSVSDAFGGFGGDTSFENILATTASSLISQNIPSLFGQFASAMDPYVRDTNDKNVILKILKKSFVNKIPWLRETLPEKVDVAGRSVKNTDYGGLALFDPFNRYAVVEDPTLDELLRLYESTGDVDFMPTNFLSGSKNTISGYDGELTDKQKETCKKRYGELWRLGGETLDKEGNKVVITGMEELMNSDAYQKMNDVEKANSLTGIMQAAKDGATREAVEAAGLKKKGAAEKPTKKTTRAMPEQFAGRTDGVFGKLAERYDATGDGSYIPKGISSSFERSEGKGENKKTYSYNLTTEEHDELYAIYEKKLTKKLKEIDWNAPEEVVAQSVENAYSSAATSAKDEWHKDHK